MVLGIEDLEAAVGLDVRARDFLRALELHDRAALVVGVTGEVELLEIQDDVGDVFSDARDRRELVEHALDLDRGDRGATDRRQQDPAQRVAERLAVTALQRLRDELAVGVGKRVLLYFESGRLDEIAPVTNVGLICHW